MTFRGFCPPIDPWLGGSKGYGATLEDLCVHRSLREERLGNPYSVLVNFKSRLNLGKPEFYGDYRQGLVGLGSEAFDV